MLVYIRLRLYLLLFHIHFIANLDKTKKRKNGAHYFHPVSNWKLYLSSLQVEEKLISPEANINQFEQREPNHVI